MTEIQNKDNDAGESYPEQNTTLQISLNACNQIVAQDPKEHSAADKCREVVMEV